MEQSEENGKKKKVKIIGIIVVLLTLAVMVGVFVIYENSKVYKECYAEAGVAIAVEDFLSRPDEKAVFDEKSDEIDVKVPGEYHVIIDTSLFSHKSVLYIQDTIPPTGKGVNIDLEMGEEREAADFVRDITDATEVQIDYAEQPDFSIPGKQEVKILLTDMGDNQTVVTSELFISQVVEEISVEAGNPAPDLKQFVIEGKEAKFVTDMQVIDYSVPGDRQVVIRVDGNMYKVTMHVVDTTPPKVEMQDVYSFTKLPQKAENFVAAVDDVTEVNISFEKEPDTDLVGEQIVEIGIVDAGGNKVVKQARLTLEEDVEPPVITGVQDLNVLIGGSISYKKNVQVTDNCPEGLSFTVDNSAVNLNVEGTYPVVYKAKDAAGNETVVSANITVRAKTYTEDEIYALADQVLTGIISPTMSPMEKVQAIYNYNKNHIAYISHSEKGNWLQAAYEGIVEGKGDCYVYACTAKALLIRAGIENMDIAKIPAKTNHYWNLVNLGDGWYHFDTTPRKDHPIIFMWTEAQLMEYSEQHNGSHNYDHSKYPTVN